MANLHHRTKDLSTCDRTAPLLARQGLQTTRRSTCVSVAVRLQKQFLLALTLVKRLPPHDFAFPIGSENAPVSLGYGCVSSMPLFSSGLFPSIGVAILNRSTHKALLIHADALTDISALMAKLFGHLASGHLKLS